jgi:hypothetical protein
LQEAPLGRTQQGGSKVAEWFGEGVIRGRGSEEALNGLREGVGGERFEVLEFVQEAGDVLGLVGEEEGRGGQEREKRGFLGLPHRGGREQIRKVGEGRAIELGKEFLQLVCKEVRRGDVDLTTRDELLDGEVKGLGEIEKLEKSGVEVNPVQLQAKLRNGVGGVEIDRVEEEGGGDFLAPVAAAEEQGAVEESGIPAVKKGGAAQAFRHGGGEVEGGEFMFGGFLATGDEASGADAGSEHVGDAAAGAFLRKAVAEVGEETLGRMGRHEKIGTGRGAGGNGGLSFNRERRGGRRRRG